MITDHIRNREKYYFLGEDYRKALDYFAAISGEPLEKCDIQVPDSDVMVKVRPMDTRPVEQCSFEAHRRYADIHFVAYGTEQIGYADIRRLKEISYDDEKDAAALEGEGDLVTLEQGYFMITFADDAHMPCVCKEQPAALGKMIAKIKL